MEVFVTDCAKIGLGSDMSRPLSGWNFKCPENHQDRIADDFKQFSVNPISQFFKPF